jgi:hypothetical protein
MRRRHPWRRFFREIGQCKERSGARLSEREEMWTHRLKVPLCAAGQGAAARFRISNFQEKESPYGKRRRDERMGTDGCRVLESLAARSEKMREIL